MPVEFLHLVGGQKVAQGQAVVELAFAGLGRLGDTAVDDNPVSLLAKKAADIDDELAGGADVLRCYHPLAKKPGVQANPVAIVRF